MSPASVDSSEMQQLVRRMRAPFDLDPQTEDRLLSGVLGPDDAPPEYRAVAAFVNALSSTPVPDQADVERFAARLATAVAISPCPTTTARRSPLSAKVRSTRLAVAALAGGLTLGGGLAAAGALPGAAQSTAADMLAQIGITVPSPNDHAGDHPDTRGSSSDHRPADAGTSDTKGAEISNLARTTDATGVDKGAEISSTASNGASQAGQHGSAGAAQGAGAAPVDTPNDGGTSTAGTASDGASTAGTDTADTASDGHSSAGSANAGAGPSNRG